MLQSGLGVVFYGRTMDSKELNDDGAHISQDDVRRAQQALQELRDFKDSMKWKDFLRGSTVSCAFFRGRSAEQWAHYHIFSRVVFCDNTFLAIRRRDPKACLQVHNWLVDVAHECGVALCKREPKPERRISTLSSKKIWRP